MALCDDQRARWLWRRLRAAFPDAVAAVLMPDHLHLIARMLEARRRKLAAVLGAFSRRFELGELWLPVPEPEPLPRGDKLARGVRYALLNPCRPWRHAGGSTRLVGDPLEWPWSTLRDAVGAIADPWTPPDELQAVLGWEASDFARSLHRYVTSDPHVDVSAGAFPASMPSSRLPSCALDQVVAAALAATRESPDALRRHGPARSLVVALLYRQGWSQASQIAEACGLHRNSIARLVRSCPPTWLNAGAMCLADPRLQIVRTETVLPLTSSLERYSLHPTMRTAAPFFG